MGVVFLAKDELLARDVALKFSCTKEWLANAVAVGLSHSEYGDASGARERFRREAIAIARLSHPSICPIHDFVKGDLYDFIVMPVVGNRSLSEEIEKNKLLDGSLLLTVACELADALTAAHECAAGPVFHRDIKPDNVRLNELGQAILVDFGLAKLVDLETLTKSGMLLGTPLYMSPEQAGGSGTDGRSDIWSLGAVIYHALCGVPPFGGTTFQELFYNIQNVPHSPIRDLRRDAPWPLVEILDRMLEKAPDDRFQNAREVRDQLLEVPRDAWNSSTRHTFFDLSALAEILFDSGASDAMRSAPRQMFIVKRAEKAASTSTSVISDLLQLISKAWYEMARSGNQLYPSLDREAGRTARSAYDALKRQRRADQRPRPGEWESLSPTERGYFTRHVHALFIQSFSALMDGLQVQALSTETLRQGIQRTVCDFDGRALALRWACYLSEACASGAEEFCTMEPIDDQLQEFADQELGIKFVPKIGLAAAEGAQEIADGDR